MDPYNIYGNLFGFSSWDENTNLRPKNHSARVVVVEDSAPEEQSSISNFFSSKWNEFKQWRNKSKTQVITEEEKLSNSLKTQIAELKYKNHQSEVKFKAIQQFIENDPELLSQFGECVIKTKDILLPPPISDDSKPLRNQLVEEWRVQSQIDHYYETMKTRFRDFLEKNNSFATLFNERFQSKKQSSQEKPHRSEISISKKSVYVVPQLSELPFCPPPLMTGLIFPLETLQKQSFPKLPLPTPQDSSKTFESKFLPTIKQKNDELTFIFRKMIDFIRADAELLILFQKECHPLLLRRVISFTRNSSNNSLTLFTSEQNRADQLALIKSHFFAFMDAHPLIKEKFIQKLHERKWK